MVYLLVTLAVLVGSLVWLLVAHTLSTLLVTTLIIGVLFLIGAHRSRHRRLP